MSGADEGRGASRGRALDDDALVAALGRASRTVAASDGRTGPPPSVWHALVRSRAQRCRPAGFWRRRASLGPVATGVALAAVAVVAIVWWRDGGRGGWSAGGLAHHPAPVAGGGVVSTSAAPLTFAVAGGSLRSGNEIDAAGSSKAEVRFSDGTDIGLFEGARLAVAGRSPDGARLRLRGGRARFQVVHRPRAAWTVDAGPYVIEVTGTVFEVRWSEADQTIEVRMQSGSVRVSGPLLSERMPLRMGQRLVARPAAGQVRVEELGVEEGRLDDVGGSGRTTGDDAAETAGPPEAPAARGSATDAVAGRPPTAVGATTPFRSGVPSRRAVWPAGEPAAAVARRSRGRARLALAHEPSASPIPAGEPPEEPEAPDRSAASVLAWQPEPLPSLDAPERLSPTPVEAEARPPLAGRPAAATAHPEMSPNLWRQRRWSAKVAAGESQAVLADAEALGIEATLAGADSQSLAALADAARYAGHPDLADKALLEERRRFPGGARAQAAAFLLGRAADDRGDALGGLGWYRRYLTEAPGGPYVAEALGREMLAIERLQGRELAVPLAAEYLRRFPNGTYLLHARALLHDR